MLCLHARQPCMNFENLNAWLLNFTVVNKNNKNLNTRQWYNFLGQCSAINFIYLDARESDFTAFCSNNKNRYTRRLYSSLGHCCVLIYLNARQ